jgi:hypothetical protein
VHLDRDVSNVNTGTQFQHTPVGRDVYPQPQTSRPVSTNNNNNNNNNNFNNLGRPNGNQGQRGTTLPPSNNFGFVSESLAGSSNSDTNHHSVPQRPSFNQATTSTTSYYDFNAGSDRRTTTTTTRRPSQVTTRKSTYFQGDLPFFSSDETSVRANIFGAFFWQL